MTVTKQKTKSAPPPPEVAPPETKERTENAEVPMWKVILIGDEEYDEGYVVQSIKQVVQDITKQKAEQCYNEASVHGASELIVVPQVNRGLRVLRVDSLALELASFFFSLSFSLSFFYGQEC